VLHSANPLLSVFWALPCVPVAHGKATVSGSDFSIFAMDVSMEKLIKKSMLINYSLIGLVGLHY